MDETSKDRLGEVSESLEAALQLAKEPKTFLEALDAFQAEDELRFAVGDLGGRLQPGVPGVLQVLQRRHHRPGGAAARDHLLLRPVERGRRGVLLRPSGQHVRSAIVNNTLYAAHNAGGVQSITIA